MLILQSLKLFECCKKNILKMEEKPYFGTKMEEKLIFEPILAPYFFQTIVPFWPHQAGCGTNRMTKIQVVWRSNDSFTRF